MKKLVSGCVLVLGLTGGFCATSSAQQPDDTKVENPAVGQSETSSPKESDSKDAADSESTTGESKDSSSTATKEESATEKTAGSAKGTEESKPATRGPARSSRDSRSQSKDVIAEFSNSTDAESADDNVAGQPKKLSFNFNLAPWTLVLKRFAQAAGLTLDMVESDTPPGTFTYLDDKKYTPTEALDLLNGYLLKRGHLLIRRDKFLVVWNIDNAIPPNLVPMVSLEDMPKRGINEYMCVLFPLGDTIDAKSAAEEVSNLVGPQGKIVQMTNSNQLKVSDIGANLREIAKFLEMARGKLDSKAMTVKSFKLVYRSASEAERELRELFSLPAKGSQAKAAAADTTGTSRTQGDTDRDGRRGGRGGGGRGGWPGMGGGGGWPGMGGGGGWPGFGGGGIPGGGGGAPAGGGEGGNDPAAAMAAMFAARGGRGGAPDASQAATGAHTYRISTSADNRTNSLHVAATVEEMRLVEDAIKAIDVKIESIDRDSAPRGKNDPKLVVYALETADPDVVVDVLNTMVPGLAIYEDTKTHRLNIYAAPSEHAEVREIIKVCDTGAGELIAVVPLNRLPATAAAASLKSLFSTSAKVDPPNIEADELGRRLLIRGTPEQVSQIKKLLTDMGEFGRAPAAGEPRRGGPRTIMARGRTASEIADLVNDLPDSVKGYLRVAPSSAAAAPGFQVWDFSDEKKVPAGGQDAFPGAGGSRGTGMIRGAGMNRNGSSREMRLPAGLSPERIQRTIDGGPLRGTDGGNDRGTDRGNDRGSDLPAGPQPGTQSRKSADVNSPNEVDDLSRRLDEALRERDELSPDESQEPLDTESDVVPAGDASSDEPADGPANGPVRERATRPFAPRPAVRGKVEIKIVGDRIRLYSDDPAALDWAEAQLEDLLAEAPNEPEWIICRLHIADATEAATMLNYLFPEGTVPRTTSSTTTGGGMFGMFASRTSATDPSTLGGNLSKAGTLKVIADVPSNSLYITGPEDVLPKVKQWLRVLDSGDSMKLPKPIEVKYADVQDIADAINGLFREETGTSQRQQGGNRGGFGNPFGGGFGGFGGNPFMIGGGNQQQQQQQRVQLSVFPDVRTNNLMVYASDKLFRQVESVVKSLDESAHAARRTVQVVTLKNVNSGVVTQTLSALTSKVQTSAAPQGTATTSNRNNQTGATGTGYGSQFGQTNMQGGGFNPFGGGQRGGQGFGGQGFGGQGFGGQGFGGQGFGGRGGGGRGGGGRQGGGN